MPHIKSIVSSSDLKKALSKLPQDGEEELRFRAVRGKRKGDKDESGGLFVGPLMLTAFEKEKGKFVSSQLFDGTIKRSVHEPETRLVLVTKSSISPLKELAKECLEQSKLKYKIVALKPGEEEPQHVGDEYVPEELTGQTTTEESPSKLKPSTVETKAREERAGQRLRESDELARRHLTENLPKSGELEKQVSRLVGGAGKQFTPVLTALKMVEKNPTNEANLADLESAAREYLKHVESDYSDKDKKDKINQLKIAQAQQILLDIEKARKLKKPTEYDSRHTATWTSALASISSEAAKLGKFREPLGAMLDQLNGQWDDATELDAVPDEMKTAMKANIGEIQKVFTGYVEQIKKLHQEHPEYGEDWFRLHDALSKVEVGISQDMGDVKVRFQTVVEQPRKDQYGMQKPPKREAVETDEDKDAFVRLVQKIAGAKDYPIAATMLMAGAETLFAGRVPISDKLHDDTANICHKKENRAKKLAELLQQPAPDLDQGKKWVVSFEQAANQVAVSLPKFGPLVKKAIEDHIVKPAALALQQAIKLPRNEWHTRLKKLEPTLKQAMEKKDEQAKEIAHQMFLAQQAIKDDLDPKDRDYGRALSLLGTVEKLVEKSLGPPTGPGAKERYEQALVSAEMGVNFVENHKDISEHRKPQLRTIVEKAKHLAAAGKYDEALSLLETIESVEKSLFEGEKWERETDVSGYGKTKELKSGGFGTTWLLGKKDSPGLVLKVANDEESTKSLDHEQEFYRKLGNHPNIARCLGKKKVDGEDGLVLEAITGGDMDKGMTTLRDRLKKGEIKHEEYWGAMQFTLVRTLEALDYMASLGYAHVDIKPDNIMYDGDTGEIKLIDLGLAAKEGEGGGGTGGFLGPEQFRGEGVGHKGDMYSLGGTAYEVGEGKRFQYNRPNAFNWQVALYQYSQTEEDALNPPDNPSQEISKEVDPKTGQREKEVGKHKIQSEYVQFVNWLMNPDPKKRPTAREALNHPFLKARMLDDDKAKEMIKSVTKPPQKK